MIAVAVNFGGAMEKIAVAYEVETGGRVQRVYSSNRVHIWCWAKEDWCWRIR
jgi:hypothetical protein